MAKAIVRVNAFLSEKQMKDVYNLIYDQVKAGLEVITVPAYCDVYILNGADIEIKTSESQKIRTHIDDTVKSCQTCKYYNNNRYSDVCHRCTHNNKWEDKDNA